MIMEQGNNIVYKIMQDVGISSYTEICQYMNLDYLIALLSKKKYYINRKKKFVDKREKIIPFKSCCILTRYDKEFTPKQEIEQENIIEATHKYEKESLLLLTSCWTERITENIMMWDRDGEHHKVCIKSTIGDFVEAFGQMDYFIWCGKILYEHMQPSIINDDVIWYKEPYFSDEREIRFYFSKDFNKIMPDNTKDDHVELSVNIQCLIKEIILSPYIKKETAEEIKQLFQTQYGIKTNLSKISIA